jgi:2-polyprenyl-3-methyl-5-hydroxy-6-metoxy-1,4-benzoquinol methylase
LADPGRRDFDAAALTWDDNPVRRELSLAVVGAIRRRVPLSAQMRAMDYGAGTGVVTLALARDLGHVLAVDSSAGMLHELDKKLRAGGITHVTTREADLTAEGPDLGPLDLIFSSMTLHHVANAAGLVARLAGLLAPGGWLAIADLDEEPGTFHPDPAGVHHHGFSAAAMAGFLEAAGLVEVEAALAHTLTRPVATGEMQDFGVLLTTGRRA